MVVATSLLGFITKAFSAFSRIERPHIAWTSVTVAIFALLTCAYVSPTPASAAPGINQQINFQGRLLNAQGATVPDGFYNIQFKIYQDGSGAAVGNPDGTLVWTESHLNNNSQGVTVKNGFLSVQLGSINAFGSQVDWNQDTLWLSMNIGNTNASCTPFTSCGPDGEMVPMKRLTAVPYALNSGLLNGLASSNFVQLAQGVQTDASTASSIFINKTASGNFLQLQNGGADVFTVSNAGDLTFGANADHTLSIATAAASTAGKTLTMAGGAGGSGTGSTGGDLVLTGGAAGGTNGNGGNVTINAGAKTGTGTDGTISIGTANTNGIVLGQSTALSAGKSLTIVGGATGTRPSSPTEGMVYFDTTTKQLLTYTNGKWQADRSGNTKIVAASNSPQDVKDAADYVADGTGDQTEINAALNAVSTIAGQTAANGSVTASGGGKVYLAEGTYVANATILIPNNTTLAGAGRGTLIELADIDATDNLIENSDTTTGTGVRIQDLRIDGRSDLNTAGTQTGIALNGLGSGITSTSRLGGQVSGVTASNFRTYGIYLTASTNNTITGNRSQNNTGGGIALNSSATYNTLSNNITQGNVYGLVIGSNNNLITNNNVLGNSNTGIYVTIGDNNTITGNSIQSNTVAGVIFITGADNNMLSNNRLVDNGDTANNDAVYINGSSGNTITGNTVSDSAATTNTALSIINITSVGTYIANNNFGGGSVVNGGNGTIFGNNVLGAGTITGAGTNTVYNGQSDGTTYRVQPADDFTITGNAASIISTTAGSLTVQGGNGTVSLGTSTNLNASGALTVASGASSALTITSNAAATWSTTAGSLTLDSATTLNLGTVNATSLSLGKSGVTTTINGDLTLATGRNLTVNGDVINDLTGSGLTVSGGALTVDSSSSTGFFRNGGNSFGTGATLGTNDANDLSLRTNGTTRATFDQSNNLYLGNGITNASPSNFVVQATGNSGTGAGASLTIQAGSSGASANGANLTLSGGTGANGVNGLVILSTPTFQNAGADANCYTGGAAVAVDCTIHSDSVNNHSSIIVGFSVSGKTATLPDPTITTPGRIVYIIGANASSDFTLSVNGGVFVSNLIALRANASATMVWNGSDWTAAGASSSTTLQAAYDNTLQSSGGAELLVSKTANTNGLTIRDSAASPVNGAVLSVQSSSAAGLLSVNSNLTEYASNAGAETKGASDTTFPASTWSSQGSSTVSRNITTNNDTIATGQGSVSVATTASDSGVKNQLVNTAGSPLALTANNHYNVSFAVRLPSNASTTFTDLKVDYSADGTTGTLTSCTTLQSAAINVWTKINCSFTAPASGITTANAIMIRQAGSTARTFYIDNLSVTIAADYNLTTDGGADNSGGIGNSGSNWDKATFGGSPAGTVAQDANDGQAASTSVKYTSVPATAKVGIRNKLAINPLPNTLYRVTVYAKSSNTFNDFMVRYTATTANSASDGDYVNCQDYNTRSVSTSAWTKITCYIKTTATTPTTSYLYFVQETGAARNFAVDTASITLSDATTPNVQVGGGTNGGPTTLFTLDRGASAPIAGDNDALLGSMYYDTTLGKLQCYEADGWGACGSSPDNIITLSPEYTNAVMHGTGVGTMISDLCSDFLNINDGSSGQSTICGVNETYNFYNWTSPQASSQTYSIYVTYQLPNTFKSFTSGSTSLQGRVSSTSNASVSYSIYKNTGSSMTQCGSSVSVASGVANAWETKIASGAADPSACGFAAGNSIVFKISMSANSNANAYIGNIGFTFSNN